MLAKINKNPETTKRFEVFYNISKLTLSILVTNEGFNKLFWA